MLLIKNCRFIPELTEGTALREGDLLIKDGKIEAILPSGAKPCNAGTIDVNGATVMPGLIDMHVHLFFTHDLQAESLLVDPCTRSFECLRYAQYLLQIGVTTVRDAGEDEYYPSVAVRNAIDAGIVEGPRVVCAGMTLCPTEAGYDLFRNTTCRVDGVLEMRKAVRTNFMKGAQYIKLYGSGSMMAKSGEPGMQIMDEDEICEAVRVASSKGSYCAMHAHGTRAIDSAVRCGVRTIEHASYIGEETLCFMDGRTDCGIVPTLATLRHIIHNTDPNTDYGSYVIEKVKASMGDIACHLKNAYKNHDVLIGWGTDTPIRAYTDDPGMEFRTRKQLLDCTNIDLLKQATINSAKLMGLEDSIGSLKAGKCADMIVVEGDPVSDIAVMYNKPKYVIMNGQIVTCTAPQFCTHMSAQGQSGL